MPNGIPDDQLEFTAPPPSAVAPFNSSTAGAIPAANSTSKPRTAVNATAATPPGEQLTAIEILLLKLIWPNRSSQLHRQARFTSLSCMWCRSIATKQCWVPAVPRTLPAAAICHAIAPT
jgi:hypothetical protein